MVIVLFYVLLMVYENEIERYNVYNYGYYMVYVVEKDIVRLKMDDDQAMVVDIVLKVMLMISVVDQIINDVMIMVNGLFLPIKIRIQNVKYLMRVNLHKSVLLVEIYLLLHMDLIVVVV